MMATETKTIRIRTLHHVQSGLFAAVSPDIRNLLVQGRSLDELQQLVPGIIKQLLEAKGYENVEVSWIEEAEMNVPPGFVIERASFDARLTYARKV